jgi:hypothetical protein
MQRLVRPEPLADVGGPLVEAFVRRHLLERSHRRQVAHLLEALEGAAPTRCVGLSGVTSSGCSARVVELVVVAVIRRVVDARLVEDVVLGAPAVEELRSSAARFAG